jgi:hypothetical protein
MPNDMGFRLLAVASDVRRFKLVRKETDFSTFVAVRFAKSGSAIVRSVEGSFKWED